MKRLGRRECLGGGLALLATGGGLRLLPACGPIVGGEGPRKIALRETTSQVIVPTFAAHADATQELSEALLAFDSDPGREALAAVERAYRAARSRWKRGTVFGMGPADELRLAAELDQSPVDSVRIEAHLRGSAAVDQATLAGVGADMKGYHALEYLLFEQAALLESEPRRRSYAASVGGLMAEGAHTLWAAWRDEYAVRFYDPSLDDAVFRGVREGVDALVNACVFTSEVLADSRLGKPMGLDSGGEPRPELEESPYSNGSLDDILDALLGLRDAYLGTRNGRAGLGLTRLVARESAGADTRARDALEYALEAVSAVPTPFRRALLEQAPELVIAHRAVKDLVRLLGSEIVSVLGATLSFNQNDGD